jgi:peptidoglycan-N-acetylglucosamine deacetylase
VIVRRLSSVLVTGLVAGLVLTAAPARAAPGVDCARVKCLALTFDDGPGRRTPELLRVLKRERVKATFFVTGKYAEQRPKVLRQTLADGHAVGNHGYSHQSMPSLLRENIVSELRATSRLIPGGTRMFRPPYGHTDERVRELAGQEGMAEILWTGTTLDWSLRDAAKIRSAVLRLAKRDGVLLLHDTVPQTVEAMPGIVRELKKRGYRLVTVPELFGSEKLWPGRQYP